MRIKSIAVFLVYLLLLFSFTIPAVACCNPPCGDCYSCINGHCICTSECCSDSDCDNCYECVDCGCEHIDCDCDNCGNWGDHDDWCLESGEYCVGDKLTGGDITPPENGSAVCVGETIELTASDGSDSDCHYYNTDCCSGCSESVGDTDITISWSDNTLRDPCVAFPGSGGNPEGSSVDWLAPSGTGDVNITATWHNNTENKYPDGSESDVITVHVVDIN
ncbi:MAG: hypothetical protein KAI59_05290, partial [Planctomycetes bacterium]|nr:hypothetical protein [Planctomycetota bacterium]